MNSYGYLYVHSGGVASSTIVNSGYMCVYSGGAASGIEVWRGGLIDVSGGGAVSGSIVVSGSATMKLEDGATLGGVTTLTGNILVADGAVVAAEKAKVNIVVDGEPSVSGWEQYVGYISDLNALSGVTLSLTVTENATGEVYLLADHAANFASDVTFTITGDTAYSGTFVWNAESGYYSPVTVGDRTYSLSIQANDTSDKKGLYLAINNHAEEIPDQVLEKLARNRDAYCVYKDQKVGDILTVSDDGQEYYFVVQKVATDDTGFYAMGLVRVASNSLSGLGQLGQSVVVCRGSETDGVQVDLDWGDDFNRNGVGIGQYNGAAAAEMRNWLSERSADEVYFTGHSLGGALAQRFAAAYSGKIGGLVTFNSPGINGGSVKRISADKVHHYIVDGDLISIVGDGYVYGGNDESWYTVYQGNNDFVGHYGWLSLDNLSGYLLNRHVETWTSDEKTEESGYIEAVEKVTPISLSSEKFSYLETPENFNGNYARFILSLATKYGNSIDDVICSCASDYWLSGKKGECVADLSTANQLTTRGKAENFRKNTDYKDFVDIVLSPWKALWDDYGIKSGIALGSKDIVATTGSRQGHQLRTLEYSGDLDTIPDLLYDFTAQEFVKLNHVKLEKDLIFTSNDHDDNVQLVRQVTVTKKENEWICFSLPWANNFMELRQIMADADRVIPISNYVVMPKSIVVLDDPGTTYSFYFERDASIVSAPANIYAAEDYITQDTDVIHVELADIDSSLTAGGENDSVCVTVRSGNMSTTLSLSETAFEGVFAGTLSLDGADGFTVFPGDDLIVYYLDPDNGTGVAEEIESEIAVLKTVPTLASGDLNGDGRADIVMTIAQEGHGAEGATGAWLIQPNQTAAWGDLSQRNAGWEIFGMGCTSADKATNDVYVKSSDNVVGAWVTDGTGKVTGWQTVGEFDANTQILGLGDFNGDGQTDLLLRNTNGAVGCHFTDGRGWNYFQSLGDEWTVAAVGDLNGDGRDDVVLKHDAGFAGSWLTQADGTMAWADLDTLQSGFEIVGAGDFNGNGIDDVLLKNGNYYGAWIVRNGGAAGWMGLGDLGDVTVEQIADFDADGIDDLRIRTSAGDLGAQLVKGADTLEWKYYGSVGNEWSTSLAAI